MGDFLAFRKMITPTVIQVIFWLGVVGCVIMGLSVLSQGETLAFVAPGVSPTLIAILILVLGPLVIRIYCELLMVLFRIYESLRNIEVIKSRGE